MTSILFLEPSLSLINVPLTLLPHFLHGILHLIHSPPDFFNVSLTPTSLSIICPVVETRSLFAPILAALKPTEGATIEEQEFVCMQIDGEGMSDGSRLLELTQPLAQAGVSILFITTYFSDYVLVAAPQMKRVRKVLLDRGFQFDDDLSHSYLASHGTGFEDARDSHAYSNSRSASPEAFEFEAEFEEQEEVEMLSSVESFTDRVAHDQGINTLQFLRQGKVPVTLAKNTKLVMVGSRCQLSEYILPLSRLFLLPEVPKFFSITHAPQAHPSLLLTKDLVDDFGSQNLLGVETAEVLIPIMLDLSNLGPAGVLGGCGIVCGVVDELMQRAIQKPASLEQLLSKEDFVMSYLSTVVTGNVLIREQDIGKLGSEDDCRMM